MKLKPWLQLFRLPNLPTAPGDALAGAAFFMSGGRGDFSCAVAAGAAALALYMFGLADNDIVGKDSDGPERPIARGDISVRAAKAARALCLAVAGIVGACAGLPPAWWYAAAVLAALVFVYNRTKNAWLMGACRGMSVAAGAYAIGMPEGVVPSMFSVFMLVLLVAGWTLYIAAVTKLSEGEESDSEGLGRWRYAWGLGAFVPLAACLFLDDPRAAVLPAVGSVFAYLAWCVAVGPLGLPHGAPERRRAVGRAIGALLYLQIGYMLVSPVKEFLVLAVVLWIAARIVRRMAPDISGS